MEYTYNSEGGKQFGRIDLDTFEFEELPSIPKTKFASGNGCFCGENIYAIGKDAELYCYNVSDCKWSQCGIKMPVGEEELWFRLLNDPQNKTHCIHMMTGYNSKSGLYRIDLDNHTVDLVSSLPVPYDYIREALLIQTEPDQFIVVAALKDGAWYCYSSKNGAWTALEKWKSFKGIYNRNYLVYSPRTLSFYYHIDETDKWETVHL